MIEIVTEPGELQREEERGAKPNMGDLLGSGAQWQMVMAFLKSINAYE